MFNTLCHTEEAKAHGTLQPFDPTSSEVHPGVRKAVLTLKLPGRAIKPTRRSHTVEEYSSDELAQDLDSAEDSDSALAPAKRRSTRAGAASANQKLGSDLPFSPKKTRSGQRVLTVHGSESDSDVQEVTRATRKSTRARTNKRVNLDDEDFEDMAFIDDASDIASTSQRKVVKKKIVRGKASRPAYGHFRVVADLQYDEEEDEELAPLIAHRGICEKCHTAPAHEQLTKAAKKGKRRRKNEDDESEDEETRLHALGGWVRW